MPNARPKLIVPTLSFLLLSALACGEGESSTAPEAPAIPEVAGAWQGVATDTFDDDQGVQVLLQQDGTRINGTVSSRIFRVDRIFPLTGTVNEEGAVTLTVAAADQGGCFDITVEMTLNARGNRLSGDYVIDRKAEGCGRMSAATIRRSFNVSR